MDGQRPLVLCVEDDADLAGKVAAYLGGHGLRVEVEGRGDRAVERLLALSPDLVVLDLLLPGLDGLSVCRDARAAGYVGPVLMLTALEDEADEVAGLEVGADDYLAKPFRLRVLLARIRALLRRSTSGTFRAARAETLVVGELIVEPGNRSASYRGQALELTTMEFDLLAYLAEHAGKPLSRDALSRRVRGVPWDGIDRSIDGVVFHLRAKLGDDGAHPSVIKSVRAVGYVLVEKT